MIKTVNKITEFSPIVSTENIGDFIIKQYCDEVIQELFEDAQKIFVPTHERLSRLALKNIAFADVSFVCGTNLLASDMRAIRQWNIHFRDILKIKYGHLRRADFRSWSPVNIWNTVKEKAAEPHIVLLGAGWHQYQDASTPYTKHLFSSLLDDQYLHSVRDSYTEKKLAQIGIQNVVNTGCPTMWGLSEEHCALIPRQKANRVVTTLTDYYMDDGLDKVMLRMLKQNYREVYIWLQCYDDFQYLNSFGELAEGVQVVSPTLEAYTKLLLSGDIDYVGTRLHGGIKALNMGCRSLILAVDNRATEIAKDTNLPVLNRKTEVQILEDRINAPWATEIVLPVDNIRRWKEQFKI